MVQPGVLDEEKSAKALGPQEEAYFKESEPDD
jgi:hypothetical protein